jgi:hypothetical protein
MQIEFDEDAHKFFVDTPFWETTVKFGDKHAFIVNTDLTDNQIKSLERIADGPSLFGNNITNAVITFDATATGFVAQKDMPTPSAGNLAGEVEFGFIQGIKQSNLLCEYWGRSAADGRRFLHITLSNRFEVDTTMAAKPFTKLPGNRSTITPVPSTRNGFHAFKINATHADHPQFQVNRFTFFSGPRDILPRKLLLRSVSCQLNFVTIFSLLDKKASKFDAISATHWSVKWKHTVTYQEKTNSQGNSEFLPKVTGPDKDLLPSGGSPASVDQVARDVIAMAQAGGPLMTPDVLNSRLRSGTGVTSTDEDRNDDFDPSFITRAH